MTATLEARVAEKDDSAQADKSDNKRRLFVLIAALAVLASVTGRALAPALPGSLSGIETWIKSVDLLSSFLAQLFACGGLVLLLYLVVSTLGTRDEDLLFKLAALPIATLVGLFVVSRMSLDYSEPKSSVALALACSSLALARAPRLLHGVSTRAAGLALALTGIAGLLHASGRLLALQANLDAVPTKFTFARTIETVAFVVEVGLLAVTATWMFGKNRWGVYKLLGALAFAGLVSYAAIQGSQQSASTWEVLASRSVGYLLRDPSPFVPTFIRGFDVVLRLALGGLILTSRKHSRTDVVMCLCLISAGATDIPVLALALTLAALMARAQRQAPPVAKASA